MGRTDGPQDPAFGGRRGRCSPAQAPGPAPHRREHRSRRWPRPEPGAPNASFVSIGPDRGSAPSTALQSNRQRSAGTHGSARGWRAKPHACCLVLKPHACCLVLRLLLGVVRGSAHADVGVPDGPRFPKRYRFATSLWCLGIAHELARTWRSNRLLDLRTFNRSGDSDGASARSSRLRFEFPQAVRSRPGGTRASV